MPNLVLLLLLLRPLIIPILHLLEDADILAAFQLVGAVGCSVEPAVRPCDDVLGEIEGFFVDEEVGIGGVFLGMGVGDVEGLLGFC